MPREIITRMLRPALNWSRPTKRLVVLALDVCLAVLATWIAFSLRFDTPHQPQGAQWIVYGLAPALALPIFVRFGLYRAIFRYSDIEALLTTGLATLLYGSVQFVVLLALQQRYPGVIPRSVGILQPLLFLLLVGASRAAARGLLRGMLDKRQESRHRLLVYGAGNAGVQTVAAMGGMGEFEVIGFVDDDQGKVRRSINGLMVYAPQDIERLIETRDVSDVLLAMPSAPQERRNRIIQDLSHLPVHVRTIPALGDLVAGRVTIQDFRELDIEDLLGRPPVQPMEGLLDGHLRQQTVLVSGAGGSIGSELCRQIVRSGPTCLILLEHSEIALYTIHEELQGLCQARGLAVELVAYLGSVRDASRLHEIMTQHRPGVVYHAAAYKHVPIVEANPAEGVLNNVFGTLNLARAAMVSGVAMFVLVSTDKAVRPTNVMGATKRVAEMILQALAAGPDDPFSSIDAAAPPGRKTVFAMVRFGNVLGSSGSVVPVFRRQIAHGGPLTVTHPDITRYFMTIPEAAQLVLQAGAMAHGGDLFVLDMGEPVRIMDLARRMIALSGLSVRDEARPDGQVAIAISGLRPGEKLYEELLIGEDAQATAHSRILRAREHFVPWTELATQLDQLKTSAQRQDLAAVRAQLQALVPDYQPAVHDAATEAPA